MTAPPQHLQPERPHRRLVNGLVAVAAVVAAGWYFAWRVGSTLGGAWLPISLPLLLVELAFALRVLFDAVTSAVLPVNAQVDVPLEVVACDAVVVVADEPIAELRRTLSSCREIQGRQGLVVVDAAGRDDVAELCGALNVPVVDPAKHVGLGTETDRPAEHLLMVPPGHLVSPHIGVALAPALSEDVGAVAGAVTVHASVSLVGSEGYPLRVDRDERMAARLDHVGAAPPGTGPVLFAKAALRSAGGVRWAASNPVLASHRSVAGAGFRTRFVHPPVAYRMATTSEPIAQLQRHRRLRAWRDAEAEIRQAGWHRVPTASALLDQGLALARLVGLAVLVITAVTAKLPMVVDDLRRGLIATGGWYVVAAVAGRLVDGRRWEGRRPLFEPTRAGIRTLGADLLSMSTDRRAGASGAITAHVVALWMALGAAALTCWFTLVRPTDASTTARIVLAFAAFAVASSVRDGAGGFRQLRQLPRADFVSRGRHDLVDLSPLGYAIEASDPPGTTRRLELDLPLPGERIRRVTIDGRVFRTSSRGDASVAHVRIQPDPAVYDDLYYFCAVTAPTIRWMGGSARVEVDGGYRLLNWSESAPAPPAGVFRGRRQRPAARDVVRR